MDGKKKAAKKREPADEEKMIISGGKAYAVIGYLWILCFIPLLVKKDNQFAIFHAKQGLVLFLVWLFLLVISMIPVLGHIVSFVGIIVILILSIQGIIHALHGEYWTMPWLGSMAEEMNIGD